jgi:hypothetical protein
VAESAVRSDPANRKSPPRLQPGAIGTAEVKEVGVSPGVHGPTESTEIRITTKKKEKGCRWRWIEPVKTSPPQAKRCFLSVRLQPDDIGAADVKEVGLTRSTRRSALPREGSEKGMMMVIVPTARKDRLTSRKRTPVAAAFICPFL